MRPSSLLATHRHAIYDLTRRYHTSNPRVFGSVAHGTDHDDSDLDLLVDAQPGVTLIDLAALENALQQLLGIPVDLLTPADLSPRFRQQVLDEAKPL